VCGDDGNDEDMGFSYLRGVVRDCDGMGVKNLFKEREREVGVLGRNMYYAYLHSKCQDSLCNLFRGMLIWTSNWVIILLLVPVYALVSLDVDAGLRYTSIPVLCAISLGIVVWVMQIG
jgi:hypothetical protein